MSGRNLFTIIGEVSPENPVRLQVIAKEILFKLVSSPRGSTPYITYSPKVITHEDRDTFETILAALKTIINNIEGDFELTSQEPAPVYKFNFSLENPWLVNEPMGKGSSRFNTITKLISLGLANLFQAGENPRIQISYTPGGTDPKPYSTYESILAKLIDMDEPALGEYRATGKVDIARSRFELTFYIPTEN